jgi:RNA polymerase sigma factor (sigma-70 family)
MDLISDYTAWLEQARAGEPAAWDLLYSAVRRQVIPGLSIPSQVDADELASETVTAVWRGIGRLRDARTILGFARTIALRILIQKRRESARYVPLSMDPATGRDDLPRQNLEGEELLGALAQSLDAADQKLFRLFYVLGKSNQEVQTNLGISGPMLRKKKHRLNKKLRKTVDNLPG